MKTLAVFLLIITKPAGYGEHVHKYPMPDMGVCMSVLKESKITPSVAVVTCVTEGQP